jgi:hypothetical protein
MLGIPILEFAPLKQGHLIPTGGFSMKRASLTAADLLDALPAERLADVLDRHRDLAAPSLMPNDVVPVARLCK